MTMSSGYFLLYVNLKFSPIYSIRTTNNTYIICIQVHHVTHYASLAVTGFEHEILTEVLMKSEDPLEFLSSLLA